MTDLAEGERLRETLRRVIAITDKTESWSFVDAVRALERVNNIAREAYCCEEHDAEDGCPVCGSQFAAPVCGVCGRPWYECEHPAAEAGDTDA